MIAFFKKLIMFLILITVAVVGQAQEQKTITLKFSSVDVEFTTSDVEFSSDEIFDVVKLKGTSLDLDAAPGTPLLPVATFQVVVPNNASFDGITFESIDLISLPGTFNIFPTQEPARFDEAAAGNIPGFTPPDMAVYNQNTHYPAEQVIFTGEGRMGGFKFFKFAFYPIQYLPVDDELLLDTIVTVTVSYSVPIGPPPPPSPTPSDTIRKLLENTVVNPEDLSKAGTPLSLIEGVAVARIDYLIITNDTLAPHFEPLATWKTDKGLAAKILTTTAIQNNAAYTGSDMQEKIRSAIKDHVMKFGTLYVLLGGDDTVVPDRDCL